jgi:opacity protein-like surface antigen
MVRSLLAIILLAVFATAAAAEENKTAQNADYELAFLTGYGITHRGFGDTRTQVQTWDAIARLGWFLSDEIGKGNWYQGRHELLVELPYHLALDHSGRSMTGGYLLGSWKFTKAAPVLPYIFAGGGILFVDTGLPTMGTRLDFSYQAGTGVQYLIRKDLALMAEYRYHHISNAGTATPNEPLNSSKILLGITLFR